MYNDMHNDMRNEIRYSMNTNVCEQTASYFMVSSCHGKTSSSVMLMMYLRARA